MAVYSHVLSDNHFRPCAAQGGEGMYCIATLQTWVSKTVTDLTDQYNGLRVNGVFSVRAELVEVRAATQG